MHGTQRRIAVLNRVDDDTHAHQIINVGEIVPAHDHLLVNGEVVLRTARHIGFDVLFVEILIDFGENLLQVHVALSGATGHQYHNLVVDLRIQNLEAEFFQLSFDGVHAKTVGERRIHIQRFTCLFLRVRLLDVTPCTGVVHTVGELDHQHAHVAAHRHHHFADGLGLAESPYSILESFVTPSTRPVTVSPNSRGIRRACSRCPPPCRAEGPLPQPAAPCQDRRGSAPLQADG